MPIVNADAMALTDTMDDCSLGAVLATALDAVVVMNLAGEVVGWNHVAERTFGWTYEEAMGRRMGEIIVPPQYRDAHEAGLARWLETGEGPVLDRHLELSAMHRSGAEIPVELSITHTSQFGEPVFLGFLRDISERRDAQRRQELMIGELNHRVRNLLGVVAGIAHQTAKSSPAVPDFLDAFQGRLASLGRAHEILTEATWERAPMSALLKELTAPYAGAGKPRITLSGPEVLLQPRELIGIGMIVHELMTNAVKYGALTHPEGRIAVVWSHEGGTMTLSWSETSAGGVTMPARHGFGTKMIGRSAAHDLHGRADFDWRPEGLHFTLAFSPEQGDAA